MKVVAFNGSARKDGNTAILIGYVFDLPGNRGFILLALAGAAGSSIVLGHHPHQG